MENRFFRLPPHQLKGPILVPLAIVIFILLAVSLIGITWVQKLHVQQGVQSHLSGVQQLYVGMQREEAKLINSILETCIKDPELQRAFVEGDRERLFAAADPIYLNLNTRFNITHFYFIKTDRTCFLRVHNPPRFGDIIDRHTLSGAVTDKGPAYGVELGPYGNLTLRIVQPWHVDGKLVGYVEMGKEIEYVIREIKKILNVEIFIIVNIRHLDRERWEEGLRVMGRSGYWEEFPRHVVIDRTMEEVPDTLAPYIKLSHQEKEGLLFKVPMKGKEFRGGFIPLLEAGGKEIGEIIFLKDFTEAERSLKLMTLLMVVISVSMAVVLFIFFYVTINRIEEKLSRSHKSLNEEITERIKAEERIKASLQEKELLLREIHHRVKNNMQIVSSLFRLQLKQIDNPKVLEILQDSQSRIAAMSLVHESLYQPQNLTGVNFRDYIRELGLNLFGSYGIDPERIQLVTDVEKISMDIDTAIPCGLIINELVANCLKHAFPDNRQGTIWLSLKRNGGDKEYILTIRDNGIGVPENIDIHNTKTLGMQLVVNLTETQLQGKIQLHRENGTEFVVIFKKAAYVKRI